MGTPGPTPDEAALVRAALGGDREALSALLRASMPIVYSFVARCVDRPLVDDVVQETYLRALRALPSIEDPQRFRSWLLSIAAHEAHRHRHADRRRSERTAAQADVDRIATGEDVAQRVVADDHLAAQRRELDAARRWLDEDDRALLSLWTLHRGGHIDRADLADVLGITPNHVSVRVHRLLRRLTACRIIVRAVGTDDRCQQLREVVRRWDGRPSAIWRRRLNRHVDTCTRCGALRRDLIPTERLLAPTPLLLLPPKLRAAIADHPFLSTISSAASRARLGALVAKPVSALATAVVVAVGAALWFPAPGHEPEAAAQKPPPLSLPAGRSASPERFPSHSTSRPARSSAPAPVRRAALPPGSGWRLTFSEDFTGDQLDPDRWHRGWACGNGQPDTCFFTSRQGTAYPRANTTVSGGTLRLTTKRQQRGQDRYTSGAVTTAGRFSQAYGYFEIRMKPAAVPGGDPAFWLASPRSWPPEIDIAEFGGAHHGRVVGNPILHTAGGREHGRTARASSDKSFNDAFHTFAMLWEPDRLVGYIDGVKTGELTGATPRESLFLIISDEVGSDSGAWFGDPANGSATRTTQVDWVRVWQRG